ncbi:MAG: hypothetical protein KAS30_00880, partial [Candidatus Diapherotrites archaeon]|nr:hypothetical protein [Candidatus Diapherotrites archaeon]
SSKDVSAQTKKSSDTSISLDNFENDFKDVSKAAVKKTDESIAVNSNQNIAVNSTKIIEKESAQKLIDNAVDQNNSLKLSPIKEVDNHKLFQQKNNEDINNEYVSVFENKIGVQPEDKGVVQPETNNGVNLNKLKETVKNLDLQDKKHIVLDVPKVKRNPFDDEPEEDVKTNEKNKKIKDL